MIIANLTYQWLGPTIFVSAGLAFLLLFFHDRKQASALRLSGAYFCAVIGFTLIMLADGNPRPAYSATIFASLFSSHFLMVWGVASLYGQKFPRVPFGLAMTVAACVIFYALLQPDLLWLRVMTASGLLVFAALMCALIVWRARSHRVDIVVAIVFGLQAALTLNRIFRIYLAQSELTTLSAFKNSPFSSSMQTENAIFAIVVGIALFARYSVSLVTRLNQLAETDPLTGLLNRRAFGTRVQALRAASAPLPAGLIICDIDHFKRVNDTHGHDAGDAALIEVARLLHNVAGEGAICARLGGEEFCIMLPESNEEMTRLAATRLRMAIEAHPIPSPGKDLRLTASFGYCVLAPDDDLSAAMVSADAAVYHSKDHGRNRVRLAAEAMPRPSHLMASGDLARGGL